MPGTTNKEKQKEGYQLAIGVMKYISKYVIAVIIILIVTTYIDNTYNFRVDDTDKDGWNRSGLRVYVDYKTGVEYVGTSKGGLCPRVNSEGKIIVRKLK